MTNRQDANSEAGTEPRESLKDGTQHKISSAPEKDALRDGALDDVSGGAWPYGTTASASYIRSGGGG
ncbi:MULTISPECIES: hypothetical protein [unclassified Bradyrhizobium]|uniref:hypothetical protein n=1 Tax=unclassified Bradyrhizobium TaxID=2631580 RepID=UPI00048AE923|nr:MULTISPECIES: hypothetical protein [unclassified Bradyrhizobium]QIG91244.1 hypothetical protein G6P99_01075 [Bradyrhizobium sp. 6(2017)]